MIPILLVFNLLKIMEVTGIKIDMHTQMYVENWDEKRIKDAERYTIFQAREERIVRRKEKI